jgi:4-amino-4-deoxy-L-arabinose transferase-like glycosyltransferase
MIFSSLLSCLAPLVIGFVLISLLWPEQTALRNELTLKLCLAVGVGFGVLSCIYFLQLSLFGPSRRGLISTQIALLAVLIAIFFYKRKSMKRSPRGEPVSEPVAESRFSRILSVLFLITLLSTAVTFVFISLKKPHGDWDAWAVYNMKARFLFRAGDHWRDLFSKPLEWASPDYPLLIPVSIAACWTLMGKETIVVPALIAMLFTLATVGIAACSVFAIRGKTQGYLAGLVLLCTPYFITHGASQYSDIPLGFFFLATLALMSLQDGSAKGDSKFLILAGMAAGLSAWTKNEGFLFLIAVLVSRFVVTVPGNGLKPYLRQMRFFAAGLLPILLVLIYFKLTISAHSLLLPAEGQNSIGKLTDFSRYRTILDSFVRVGLGFRTWPAVVPLLAFYLLLLRIRIEPKERASIAGSLIVLAVMIAGYFMIFVISPRDLAWHLSASVDRLYAQLWPSFIFIFFLIVRTPEQAFIED